MFKLLKFLIQIKLRFAPVTEANTKLYFKYVFTNKERITLCQKILHNVLEAKIQNSTIFLCVDTSFILVTQTSKTYGSKLIQLSEDVRTSANIIQIFLPEFTRENAVKYAYANSNIEKNYWWEISDYNNRQIFLNWLIKHYTQTI